MTDTPKILRDMNDAEIGALVRSNAKGEKLQFLYREFTWLTIPDGPIFRPDTAYRIAPQKFLPLEAGKVYVQADGNEVKCIHVEGGFAHMRSVGHRSAAAYVWYSDSGKSKSMGKVGYHITGLSENQEAGQ